jgi:hypothetical protein
MFEAGLITRSCSKTNTRSTSAAAAAVQLCCDQHTAYVAPVPMLSACCLQKKMTGDAFGVVGPRSMAHIQAQIRRLQDLGGYLPQRGHLQNVFREQLKGVEAAMSQVRGR